jgi:hypothetical protein
MFTTTKPFLTLKVPCSEKTTIEAEFGVANQQLIADKQTLQQLSEDFTTKFRIARTAASSLEWQSKYSITELLNTSEHAHCQFSY